jgi:hypothetical protein
MIYSRLTQKVKNYTNKTDEETLFVLEDDGMKFFGTEEAKESLP